MNLVIFSPECPVPFDRSGTSVVVHNFATELSFNHDVIVYFPADIYPYYSDLYNNIPYSLRPYNLISSKFSLLKILCVPRNSYWIYKKTFDIIY
jgi:hypothetical protein